MTIDRSKEVFERMLGGEVKRLAEFQRRETYRMIPPPPPWWRPIQRHRWVMSVWRLVEFEQRRES